MLFPLMMCSTARKDDLFYTEYKRISELTSTVATKDQHEFTIRWNPCFCHCPEYEIYLDNEWHRVDVSYGSGDVEKIFNELRVKDKTLEGIEVSGTISGKKYGTCKNGQPFMVLTVNGLKGSTAQPSQ